MRRAIRDKMFMFEGENNTGRLVGLSLGSDYAAEHEQGVREIQFSFGITSDIKVFGKQRRAITKVHKNFDWVDYEFESYDKKHRAQGFYFLDGGAESRYSNSIVDFLKVYSFDKLYKKDETLITGWCHDRFAAVSIDEKEVNYLGELFEAFKNKDGLIWAGRANPFGGGGLVLAIASRLPEEHAEKWYAADKEAYEVRQEVSKSGIEYKLKEAGKNYYALSPSRSKDGQLIFWLNPTDQHLNNSMWCTLKDLEDWIAGKGPIPKTK